MAVPRFVLYFASFLSLSAYAESIKVGVALRFSPEVGSSVESLYRGVELAKDRFNKQNTKKLTIELVKYSHKRDLKTVDDAAKKIIKDQVKFVIGGEMSDEALTLGDHFEKKDILLMTPTASNPRVTENRPLVYRTCFSDHQTAARLAKYVDSLKGINSIGVLHHTGNAYADYLTIEFLKKLEQAGKNIPQKNLQITEFKYAGDRPDFTPAVEQFKKQGVKLVVSFNILSDIRSFYGAAVKGSFFPKYLGSDGWGSPSNVYKNLVEAQTNKSFEAVFTSYWHQEGKKQPAGMPTDSVSAVAYDAAMVLFSAIEKSKLAEKEVAVSDVVTALKTGHFTHLTTAPEIKFNSSNSPDKTLHLYEVNAKGAKFLKSI